MKNGGDGFMYADLSALEDVKMRSTYGSIGCKAKFSLQGELLTITKAGSTFSPVDSDKPGDHWRGCACRYQLSPVLTAPGCSA
jgi:hypothetical protein